VRAIPLLTILLAAPGALAEDLWTDPYPGVRHLARADRYDYDERPAYRLHALVVDLTDPAVSIHATPPDAASSTVRAFADRLGLAAAWNTNFFGSTRDSCGLMMGAGQIWATGYQDACHASVGFGAENQAGIFTQPNPLGPPPEAWMREIATGKPEAILVGGEPRFAYGCGSPCAYNPRTGMGLSADRRTLYVVVVDGRQDDSVGAGLDDLANLMRDLGAHDAINLDGGGSSTLYVRDEGGVANRPSSGVERTVCCHMGLRVDPQASWWRAELVEQAAAPPPLMPGETVELWARFRNTGRRTWRGDGEHPMRLGTAGDRDRESAWRHVSWVSANRVVEAPEAGPGAAVEVRFTVQAPAAGVYDERFALVAEGASWLDPPQVGWRLEVVEPQAGDAGVRPDASSVPDAHVEASDAEAPRPDAPIPDAAVTPLPAPPAPRPDASVRTADAGLHAPGGASHGGDCSSGGAPGHGGWLMLVLVGVLSRTFPRGPGTPVQWRRRWVNRREREPRR
jgi:hypothetical protein